jgi:glycosyltransferase involved in cell wall biosynthesis
MSSRTLLYLTNKTPYASDSGWALRMLAHLSALAQLCKVIFIGGRPWYQSRDAAQKDAAARTLLAAYCNEVHLFSPPDPGSNMRQMLRRLARSGVRMSVFGYNPAVERLLSIYASQYQVAWLDTTFSAHYVSRLLPGALKVMDTHNVESSLAWQEYRTLAPGLNKLRSLARWANIAWAEKAYFPRFDYITAVSQEDAASYQSWLPAEKIVFLPNTIQVPSHLPEKSEAGMNILFTGKLSYFPNQNGIRWLVAQVFPEIQKRVPTVRLYIVGNAPPADIQALHSEAIIVTGKVPSVQPYQQMASVFVCPLWEGGGSRLKIIEAMAAGIPVVSTSKGAEGIEARHAEHLYVADDAYAFARLVSDLLLDDEKRSQIAQHAFHLVRDLYSWDANARRISALLAQSPALVGESLS